MSLWYMLHANAAVAAVVEDTDVCPLVAGALSRSMGGSEGSKRHTGPPLNLVAVLAAASAAGRRQLGEAGACKAVMQCGVQRQQEPGGVNTPDTGSTNYVRADVCDAVAALANDSGANASRLVDAGACELLLRYLRDRTSNLYVQVTACQAVRALAESSGAAQERRVAGGAVDAVQATMLRRDSHRRVHDCGALALKALTGAVPSVL
jgi:hypothetical protein